jgi:hypothetical protein
MYIRKRYVQLFLAFCEWRQTNLLWDVPYLWTEISFNVVLHTDLPLLVKFRLKILKLFFLISTVECWALWIMFLYKLVFIYRTHFQKCPEICSVCLKDGHSKDKCKTQQLTKFDVTLPPLDMYYKDVMDKLCAHVLGKKWGKCWTDCVDTC